MTSALAFARQETGENFDNRTCQVSHALSDSWQFPQIQALQSHWSLKQNLLSCQKAKIYNNYEQNLYILKKLLNKSVRFRKLYITYEARSQA